MRFMLMAFLIILTLFATSHAGKKKDLSTFKMSIAMAAILKPTCCLMTCLRLCCAAYYCKWQML